MLDKKYTALVVDDERLAREDLTYYLSKYPEIEIIREAASVKSAAALVEECSPDVIFLDVHMPEESGFGLFHRVKITCPVIFVTAYDNYAIRAFEVNALDYLLKPIHRIRLAQTITRLFAKDNQNSSPVAAPKKLEYSDQVFVKTGDTCEFVPLDNIICIQSSRDYTELYLASQGKKFIHKSMLEWEELLPHTSFIRIHRSTLININHLSKIEKSSSGAYQIYLKGLAEPLSISRSYWPNIKKLIN